MPSQGTRTGSGSNVNNNGTAASSAAAVPFGGAAGAAATSQASKVDIQMRMQSLMHEMHGLMMQMNGPPPVQVTSVGTGAIRRENVALGGNSPFTAFPIPGVHASASTGAQSLDQDLARLLPPDVIRGNSPPMDPDRWMSSMLGHLATGAVVGVGPGASGTMPAVPAQLFSAPPPMVAAAPSVRMPKVAVKTKPPAPDFVPHGRSTGTFGDPGAASSLNRTGVNSISSGGNSGGRVDHAEPETSMWGTPPPSAHTGGDASSTHAAVPPVTAAAAGATPGANFKPNLAAKPFRPTQQFGAPIPPESLAMLQEAFGNAYPVLHDGGSTLPLPLPHKTVHHSENDEEPSAAATSPSGRNGKRRGGAGRRQGGRDAGPPLEEEALDATTPMAYVEFKRQKIKKYPCNGVIQPGQYVIVDGDRGQDCGLLVQMTAPTPDGKLSVLAMEGSVLEDQKLKVERGRVIRVAEPHEVDLLHNEIAASERNALRTCRQRCADLGLNIDILDCEYQFDMKKISFYFNSDKSVDFRDLVRELYRTFGARIWMENINPNVKNVVPQNSGGRFDRGGASHKHLSAPS